MEFDIIVTDTIDEKTRAAILDPLVAYNKEKTGISDHRPLAILLIDAKAAVIGGLWGHTGYGWLFTEWLVVQEELRGQGLGTALVLRAEAEALARGCHSAWLDTFEFQARGFYEQIGYECFGELTDYPTGFSRYFMKKTLLNRGE